MSEEVIKALQCLGINIYSSKFKNLNLIDLDRAYKKQAFKFKLKKKFKNIGEDFLRNLNNSYNLLRRMYFNYFSYLQG